MTGGAGGGSGFKTIKDKVRAMRELLLSDEYAEQKRAVNRFMLLLSTLYSLDAQAFAEATESLHGRTRVYFAADRQTIDPPARYVLSHENLHC